MLSRKARTHPGVAAIAILVFSVCASCVVVPPQNGGANPATVQPHWTATGSMHAARHSFTATRLRNGKVLVAAGDSCNNRCLLSSAELYDPATGKFSPTGSLHVARKSHTATLLWNGTVLVAGGLSFPPGVPQGRAEPSSELYNPATGRWTLTGSMTTGRWAHTATRLVDGKVLVAGGIDPSGYVSSSAELYDPATHHWAVTGSFFDPRSDHTATRLQNGQVLIAGGFGSSGPGTISGELTSADLYDPVTHRWTVTGPLITPREFHTATILRDGQVLVTGGFIVITGPHAYAAELYNPRTGIWSATGVPKAQRAEHTATRLRDGRILVAGGLATPWFTASAEVYDPASGTWTDAGSMSTPREDFTMTRLLDGRVLVAGGFNNAPSSPFTATASADVYQPRGTPNDDDCATSDC